MTEDSKVTAKAKVKTKAKAKAKATVKVKEPPAEKVKAKPKAKPKAKAKAKPKIEIKVEVSAETKAKAMSHGRLITRFTQLGPYLRKEKSSEEGYFFDCLSACVNAKKTPETREFWGWWLELTRKKNGFKYIYSFGKYDTAGNWKKSAVPSKCTQSVNDSLDVFYQKICVFLEEELQLEISALSSFKGRKLSVSR